MMNLSIVNPFFVIPQKKGQLLNVEETITYFYRIKEKPLLTIFVIMPL